MLASRIVLISEMKERYSMAVDFSSFLFLFFLVFDFCFASKWFTSLLCCLILLAYI